jgi:hypothetical protein
MEPEGSSSHSQELSSYPYPELDQSDPQDLIPSLQIHLNIISPAIRGLRSDLFPSGFPTNDI